MNSSVGAPGGMVMTEAGAEAVVAFSPELAGVPALEAGGAGVWGGVMRM